MHIKFLRAGVSAIAVASIFAGIVPAAASAAPAAAATVPAAATVAAAVMPAWAQDASDIKPDPAVRFGVLANGMRYAVLHNETPADGVAMRMYVGAGSMNERDDEQGLAHFLEHMSFRGSKNVPDGEVVRMLERRGLSFGADTNAGTSQDRIVYIFNFPKSDAGSMADGLTILRDVASGLNITPALVDAERGVVISEERIRDTPQGRMGKALLSQALAGSRAIDRFPIGTVDVLKTAPASRLKRYYQANFRPENAALVIVGNVDAAAVERDIRARFGDWQPVGPADVLVPGTPAPTKTAGELVQAGAPDLLALSWSAPANLAPDTAAGERTKFMRLIAQSVFSTRLGELASRPGSPLAAAQFSATDKLFGIASFANLVAVGPADKWRDALTAVTQEQRRAVRDGISAEELARAVAGLRTAFQNAAANAQTRTSESLANALVDAAADRDVFTNPAQDLAFVTPLLNSVTTDQASAALRSLFAGSGPVLFRSAQAGPVGADVLAAALRDAYAAPLAAKVTEAAIAWPYDNFGTPSKVVSRVADAALGSTTVTFANGTRLIVKPTTFERDTIRVTVGLGGGKAAVPANLTHAAWATDAFTAGGTGKLSSIQLNRWSETNGYNVTAGLSELPGMTQLSGVTRGADLGRQLELLAAFARDPGFRPEGDEKVAQIAPLITGQISGNVLTSFQRARSAVFMGNQPRFADLPSNADLAATRPGDLAALVRPQLAGPADIAIVGAVTVDAAIAAVAHTFGAGPKRARTVLVPARVTMAQGNAEPQVFEHSGRADQAMYAVYWPLPDYFADPQTAEASEILGKVIGQRMVDSVREKLGLTYSPMTDAAAGRQIAGYGFIGSAIETPQVNFPTFRGIVLDQIKDLAERPVGADELLRAKRPVIEARGQRLQRNEYWAAVLPLTLRDPRQRAPILSSVAAAEAVTAADLQRVARIYLQGKVPITVVVKGKQP